MPAAAAGWLVAAVSVGSGISYVAATALFWGIYGVTALGINYALGAITSALMGRPKLGGGSPLRDMVIKSTTAARAIIYGEVTVGGVIVFEHTTGDKNQYLDYVVVIAGHQCESITDVWFDDVLITNAEINSGNAAGGAVGGSGTFRNRYGTPIAYIYKHLGTDAQTASSVLSDSGSGGYGLSGTWTTDHRLRGCTYAHIRLRRTDYYEEHGAPSSFKFRVKGAKVYDPRLDTTNGGSGTHRLDNATTWAWSPNPALCAADYMAGGTIANDVATPVRRRGFAVQTPATDIDWDAVIAAANICDENVSIPPSGTQDRYVCDCVLVPSDDSPDSDCIEQILSSMLGQVVYTAGTYILYAGAYQTPTMTLTEEDLAGPIKYVTSAGRSERYNYVRGTRYDLTQGQALEFLPRTDATYVTADGKTLFRDIELPATQNEYRAQRIAQTILRRSREQQSIIWPGQLSAAKVGIWATCFVTVAELGITDKVFRCIGRKIRPTTNGEEPIVELTLREENSSTYSDPLVADYGSVTVAADPGPISSVVESATGLVATSLSGYIKFVITPATGASSSTVYDLYEHTASTPFSSATLLLSANATTIIVSKADTTTRYYWVKARRNEDSSTQYPATTGVSGVALAGPQDGVDGEDGISVSLSLYSFNIACDSAGVPISGAFTDAVGQVTVYSGSTDVTASATYSGTTSSVTGSVNTATNTPVTGAKGSYRITAMAATSGYLQISVTYGGQTHVVRFTVQKALAGTPATTATTSTINVTQNASYTAIAGPLTMGVGPSGTVSGSALRGYSVASGAGASLDGKIQYRTTPGSGGWTDFDGGADSGSTATIGEPGSLNASDTVAGPGTAANWEFQVVALKVGTSTLSNSGTGRFTVSWAS
jgi:hypothetical protein